MVGQDAPAHLLHTALPPGRLYSSLEEQYDWWWQISSSHLECDILCSWPVTESSAWTLTRVPADWTALGVTPGHATRAEHGGGAGSAPRVSLEIRGVRDLRHNTLVTQPLSSHTCSRQSRYLDRFSETQAEWAPRRWRCSLWTTCTWGPSAPRGRTGSPETGLNYLSLYRTWWFVFRVSPDFPSKSNQGDGSTMTPWP